MKTRRPALGLTLLELMVAVAIVAVLGSLALPEIGRSLAKARLQAAAQALAADLDDTRHAAVRVGRELHLQMQGGTAGCWSVSAMPGCTCGEVRACQMQRHAIREWKAVRIDEAASWSFPPGVEVRPAAPAATLSTAWGDRLQVRLTPMGRPRVCSPDAAAGTRDAC